jgi:choline dehydrogenase-like flavoprotein
VPSNSVDGLRLNTGVSYLLPALDRPNLTVVGDCQVHRVVVRNGRATGVVARRGGRQTVLRAEEVVLCAGSFATAQLLHLSGVGPRAELERLGIPVVKDAPAVGSRLSDHPQVVLEWAPLRKLDPPTDSWLGGCLHLSSSDRTHPGDLEILQSLVPMAGLVGGTVTAPGAPQALLVSVQTPRATGRLSLRSADPAALPRNGYGYLADAQDRRRLREAVRTTAELLATGAFAAVSQGMRPGRDVLDSDDALDDWLRRSLGTAHHTCGTVPMGPEGRRAAVDQYGRVHGVRGLRVADASVLPTAPLRGPAATAALVGEVVADAMRRALS